MIETKKVPSTMTAFRVTECENYFGKITIRKASFDFNLSLPFPVWCLNKIGIKKTKSYQELFQITLMNDCSKIKLEPSEYYFFYVFFLINLQVVELKFGRVPKFFSKVNIVTSLKSVELLNLPKFNCRIA